MRQHAGVFAANFSSNLLWQNCFAPKKCAFCTEPRRAAAGIPDVCQGGATTGLRKTRLLRRMFSYVRRPKGWAFQSVKEPARSRISEAVGRDPCVPPRKGIRIPLASLCEGGGSAKRWRRERFHTVFSPSVGCADSPPPRGGLAARHRRADGTSYPKGICSAALHGRTPSPTPNVRVHPPVFS